MHKKIACEERSKPNNHLIVVIQECRNESWDQCMKEVQKIFEEKKIISKENPSSWYSFINVNMTMAS